VEEQSLKTFDGLTEAYRGTLTKYAEIFMNAEVSALSIGRPDHGGALHRPAYKNSSNPSLPTRTKKSEAKFLGLEQESAGAKPGRFLHNVRSGKM
jgi:hypothetical protein